jgi:transcriptional regulator with XRE-family HTH domain
MIAKTRPGATLRALRRANDWTLAQVAERTGIPISTLSRMENDQASPSYDQLQRLSRGLQIDIAQLFSPIELAPVGQSGRRSVNRVHEGQVIDNGNDRLRYLSTDLLNKSFTPMIAEIKGRRIESDADFHSHAGEEFVYVIEGELELHSRSYAPLVLRAGESIYFDSSTPHAYVALGTSACRALSICTVPHVSVPQVSAAAPAQQALPVMKQRRPRMAAGKSRRARR